MVIVPIRLYINLCLMLQPIKIAQTACNLYTAYAS